MSTNDRVTLYGMFGGVVYASVTSEYSQEASHQVQTCCAAIAFHLTKCTPTVLDWTSIYCMYRFIHVNLKFNSFGEARTAFLAANINFFWEPRFRSAASQYQFVIPKKLYHVILEYFHWLKMRLITMRIRTVSLFFFLEITENFSRLLSDST